MRLRLPILFVCLGCLAWAASASATDLNFDDINTDGGVVAMPNGYGGWSWDHNFGVYGSEQDPYNAHTPPNRALFNFDQCCDYAESLVTSLNGPVTFQGAWFAGWDFAGPVFFNLYLGGNLVWTSGSMFPSNVPTFLDSGYAGMVDQVGIVGGEGFFVMDDFTFNGGGGVPEPGTLLMLGSGVVALGGVLRRKLSL